jgi:hypothetical protein
MDLDLLVDGVQIEQENQSNQAANRSPDGKRKIGIGLLEKVGEGGHPGR